MRARLLVIFIFSMVLSEAFGQAVFESRRSNRWNRSQTWNLISGSDADGIPDANDDVILRSGNSIRLNSDEACNNLTFDGGHLQFQGGNRILDVNGDVTVTGSSSLDGFNANQVFTILGDLDVNSGASLSIPSITYVIDGPLP